MASPTRRIQLFMIFAWQHAATHRELRLIIEHAERRRLVQRMWQRWHVRRSAQKRQRLYFNREKKKKNSMFLRSKISPKKMALTGEAVEDEHEFRLDPTSSRSSAPSRDFSSFSSRPRWYVLQRSSLLFFQCCFFSVLHAFNGTIFTFLRTTYRNSGIFMLQFFYRFYV